MGTREADVVIVGAGIAGCMIALCLGLAGKNVLVLERSSSVGFGGSDFLKPRGIEVLQKYNLEEELFKHGAYKRNIIRYYHDRVCIIHLDYTECTELGYYIIIPCAVLMRVLLEKIAGLPNVEFWFNSHIQSIDIYEDTVQNIMLNDERKVQAAVIVGADGENSSVRSRLGVSSEQQTYDHAIYMADFPLVSSVKEYNRLYMSSDRWFAYFYPITSEQFRAAISFPGAKEREVFLDHPELLRESLTTFVSESDDVLEVLGDSSSFRKFPVGSMCVTQFYRGNAVLIGNATSKVHPMTGQGMNLAIEDADVLCNYLVRFFQGSISLTHALESYSQQRHGIHQRLVAYGNLLANTFHDRASYLRHFDPLLHAGAVR